jgi:lysophospholipase L1-like esterase
MGVAVFRKHITTIAVVALATAVPLAALELTARVLTHFRILHSWKPLQVVWPKETEDYRLAHLTLDDYREPDPLLIWKPVPGRPYNAQRFKGPLMAVPKPAGIFRIMCYGDSNTDGPDRGGWPDQLQQLLDKRGGEGGVRYEVVNAGVVGYSSHQGLLRFRQEVERYQPDLVIVSFGWNDAAEVGGGRPDRDYQPSAWRVSVLRVLLKSRLFLVLMRYRSEQPSAQPQEHAARVPLSDYIKNMESFAEITGKHGASVVFLTRPHREQEAKLRLFQIWERQVPAYNSRLRLWAQERRLPLIDVQAIFERAGADFFADKSHFTAAGDERMANTLIIDLVGRRLIPGIRPQQRGSPHDTRRGRARPMGPPKFFGRHRARVSGQKPSVE